MIREIAPAKINLALHVRHRRSDGYHELETLFAFARDGDVVTVERADEDSFTIDGSFADALHHPRPSHPLCGRAQCQVNSAPHCSGQAGGLTDLTLLSQREREGGAKRRKAEGEYAPASNLVTRARDSFRTVHPDTPRVAITLTKNLPVASGIGGGSADAAATLRALARLIGIDPATLHDIAAALGADVPACLHGRTALGTGRGDALADLSGLEGTPLLLVNPGVGVSTAAVFAGWDGIDRGPLAGGDLLARAQHGRNDLEAPATALAPVIEEVRALLDAAPGAILSRMSGSGATCFALFAAKTDRDSAAQAAAARGWWTLATQLA